MFILSDFVDPPSSWRSKIAGYAAKEFVLCCMLHIYDNAESGFGGLLRGVRLVFKCPLIDGVVRWWGLW